MKIKKLLLLAYALFLTTPFAQANTCIDNIELHKMDYALNLGNCQLTDNDIPAINAYLDRARPIEHLYLNNNQLTDKAGSLLSLKKTNRNISILDISHNPLTDHFAENLLNNPSANYLLHIKLNHTQLTSAGVKTLTHFKYFMSMSLNDNNIDEEGVLALANYSQLVVLYLDNNKTPITQTSIAALANKEWYILSLNNNHIGDLSGETLAKKIKPYYKDIGIRLSLSGNDLHDSIAFFLANNSYITDLDVSHNKIGDAGAIVLMHKPGKNLSSLNLGNNPLTIQSLKALVNASFINKLDISQVNLTDKDAILLAAEMKSPPKFINMAENKLSEQGLLALIKNPTLKSIGLSKNNINTQTAIKIAEQVSPQVIGILFDENPINKEAVRLFLKHPTLKAVGFQNNDQVTDDVLLAGTSLKEFDCSHCQIGDKGAAALAHSLSLQSLDVQFNHITKIGLIELRSRPDLQNLPSLKTEGNNY
jgi:Ran GTPase-activating protein (RanGAP) involved in mRNA processing and transport